jgi:hypothetical protein
VTATLVNVVVFWVIAPYSLVHEYHGFGETHILSSRQTNNCTSFRKYIKGAPRLDTKNHYHVPVLPEEHSVGRKLIIMKTETVCSSETSVATYQATRCHNQKITILSFKALKTLNFDIPVLFQYACVPFRSLLDKTGNSSALLFLQELFLSISGRQGRTRKKISADKKLNAETTRIQS